jgi:uncharacterized protein YhbP (UPF0306 family)
MSIDAAFAFLGSQELVVICSASLQGVPHAAPSFYALDGHNIVFTTSDKSRTGSNVLSNPIAAVAAGDAPDPGQTWNDAKGIQIVGRVVHLSGDDATRAAGMLRASYEHLGDSIMQSDFFRLEPTSVEYIRNAPDGDEEFEALGVDWAREQY